MCIYTYAYMQYIHICLPPLNPYLSRAVCITIPHVQPPRADVGNEVAGMGKFGKQGMDMWESRERLISLNSAEGPFYACMIPIW